jgi:hypothetical protein
MRILAVLAGAVALLHSGAAARAQQVAPSLSLDNVKQAVDHANEQTMKHVAGQLAMFPAQRVSAPQTAARHAVLGIPGTPGDGHFEAALKNITDQANREATVRMATVPRH